MIIKINGRSQFFNCSSDEISIVRQEGSKHKHIVSFRHGTYRVFGGKQGGGTSREWFVEPVGETAIFRSNTNGYLSATSLVDAIRLIVNA